MEIVNNIHLLTMLPTVLIIHLITMATVHIIGILTVLVDIILLKIFNTYGILFRLLASRWLMSS